MYNMPGRPPWACGLLHSGIFHIIDVYPTVPYIVSCRCPSDSRVCFVCLSVCLSVCQSTDKNLLVPVGGSIVAAFDYGRNRHYMDPNGQPDRTQPRTHTPNTSGLSTSEKPLALGLIELSQKGHAREAATDAIDAVQEAEDIRWQAVEKTELVACNYPGRASMAPLMGQEEEEEEDR